MAKKTDKTPKEKKETFDRVLKSFMKPKPDKKKKS